MNRTTILFIISILFSLIIFSFYNPSEFFLVSYDSTVFTNNNNNNSLGTKPSNHRHQKRVFLNELDLWCQNKSSRCYSPLCYAPTKFLDEGGCISNPYFKRDPKTETECPASVNALANLAVTMPSAW